jgi:hypothetical protein
LEAKSWKDALRMYRAGGEEASAAKALEKLGEYDDALEIWMRIGKPRDLARVAKAMAKGVKKSDGKDARQLDLL